MARSKAKPLTDRGIHHLKFKTDENDKIVTREDGSPVDTFTHHDGGGLYVQVSPGPNGTVNRYFFAKVYLDGRDRSFGIGHYPEWTLAAARKERDRVRALAKAGIDPIKERRNAKAENIKRDRAGQTPGITFDQCAEQYIELHKPGWTDPRYAAQWKQAIKDYASPFIGALAVADIDDQDVLRVLEPIWHTKTVTAHRLRGQIELILGWAAGKRFRPRGPNPAAWRDNLAHVLPKASKVHEVENYAALDAEDVPLFMRELASDPLLGARALEFCILTWLPQHLPRLGRR
jgi:hypothetical protein